MAREMGLGFLPSGPAAGRAFVRSAKAILDHPILLARNTTFPGVGRGVVSFIPTRPVPIVTLRRRPGGRENRALSGPTLFRECKLGRLVWRPTALLRQHIDSLICTSQYCAEWLIR